MSTVLWTELAERMTRTIESHIEVLSEHDGGPYSLKADVILARLYGLDGQVDALWRIHEVRDVLLRPISRMPVRLDLDPMVADLSTAKYVLQSSWAKMTLDYLTYRDLLPPDVEPSTGTNTVTVALLRYRRRI